MAFTQHEKEVFTATLVELSKHKEFFMGDMPFDNSDGDRLNVMFLMWREGRQQQLDLFNELCDVSDDIDFIKRVMNKAGNVMDRLPEGEAL